MIQTITSNSGKKITVRFPTLADIQAIWEYINMLSKERTYITYQGEEIPFIEEEKFVKEAIEKIEKNKNVTLLGFDDTKLIGMVDINMQPRIDRHIGVFGITLHKDYRSDDIGKQLMNMCIDLAKERIEELEIITLGVFGSNGKACKLYEKMGFVTYGVLPKGVKLEHSYVDHIYMYKRVR